MKVVLDTNLLVSGLMTAGGNCARILDLVFDGQLTVVVDDRILAEYTRVCAEPRLRLEHEATRDMLRLLADFAERVVASPLKVRLPDPDDLPFLEAAAASTAVLITGNKKHFPTHATGRLLVMNPAEFLAHLGGR